MNQVLVCYKEVQQHFRASEQKYDLQQTIYVWISVDGFLSINFVFLGDQQTVLVWKHLTCHTATCYHAASSFIGVQYDVSDTAHLHHSSPLKLLLRPCGQRNRADNNSACIDHQGQVSIAFPPRAFPSACLCDFSFMAVFPDPLPRPAKLAKKTKTTTTTQTELKTPHSPLNNCHLFFLRILARVAIDTDPLNLSFVCPTVLSFKTFSGEQKMDKDAENHFQLCVKEKSNLPWDCEMSEGQWQSACRRSDQRWCFFKSRKSQTTPTRVVLDAEFVFNCSAFSSKKPCCVYSMSESVKAAYLSVVSVDDCLPRLIATTCTQPWAFNSTSRQGHYRSTITNPHGMKHWHFDVCQRTLLKYLEARPCIT